MILKNAITRVLETEKILVGRRVPWKNVMYFQSIK
jgi:hypothetical protein